MWKKIWWTRQTTDDNIIRDVYFTCWIHKATYTLSEYVIIFIVARQHWLQERASMLRLCLGLHCTFLSVFPILNNWTPIGGYTTHLGVYTQSRRFDVLKWLIIFILLLFLSLKISGNNSPAWCKHYPFQSVHIFIRDADRNQSVFGIIQKYFQIPRVPQHLELFSQLLCKS